MNVVRILEESAKKRPWRKACIYDGKSLSFRGLYKKVKLLAFGLKEKLEVRSGDRVAVLLGNCPEFIISLFAILKIKAICVPVNIFLTAQEIKYILADSGAKILISSNDFIDIVRGLQKARLDENEALSESVSLQ